MDVTNVLDYISDVSTPRSSLFLHPRRPNTAAFASPTFVDLQDDEHEAAPPGTNKRSHVEMAEEHQVFRRNHMKKNPQHGRQSVGGDQPAPNSARAALSRRLYIIR